MNLHLCVKIGQFILKVQQKNTAKGLFFIVCAGVKSRLQPLDRVRSPKPYLQTPYTK